MATVTVRRLAPDEWETWRDLRLRSLADSPDSFGSTLTREQSFTEHDWRARTGGMSVLAFVDGTPAAMGGGFSPKQGWIHVFAMWTDPAHRRQGLSVRVLDEIVRLSRADGFRVMLDVTRGNDAARAAYERYGFVATGASEPLREGSSLRTDEMVLPQ